MPLCNNCGEDIPEESLFCPMCGAAHTAAPRDEERVEAPSAESDQNAPVEVEEANAADVEDVSAAVSDAPQHSIGEEKEPERIEISISEEKSEEAAEVSPEEAGPVGKSAE